MPFHIDRLVWLGHAGFFFPGPPRIYIDPFRIAGSPPADVVLLTHPHYDHCSPADLAPILTDDTEVVCPRDCLTALRELPGARRLVEPGSTLTVRNLSVEAVPAYTRKSRMHGRDQRWVGYIVDIDGVRWYHAGDTDYIPEMRDMRVDIACLPISGGETMTMVEAAAAANCLKPKVVVPMHYGTLGDRVDPGVFGSLTRIAVRTMERHPEFAVG